MDLQPAPEAHPDEGDIDALATLHRMTADTLAGMTRLVEKAVPAFRPTAIRFRDLHAAQEVQLFQMLTDLGRQGDRDGSLMASVNETVVSLRALFDNIDAGVMAQVRAGEGHILRAFDAALAARLPAGQAMALRAMRADLAALLHHTAALA